MTVVKSLKDVTLDSSLGEIDAVGVLQDLCGVDEIEESGDELNHSCKLPFGMHSNGDRNKSASLNQSTLTFNCFVCGGGSIVWLVENILDITHEQALTKLKYYSSEAVVVEYDKFLEKMHQKLDINKSADIKTIPSYSENIIFQWIKETDYMKFRGVSSEVQLEMKTGIRELIEEWVNGGKEKVLTTRIIIPHFFNGKLVGWQGRKLSNDNRLHKYKNSKDFPKALTLYNYDNINCDKEVVVVESPMSVLKLKSEGITNVVSTFGASVSEHQIELLKNYRKICVWMDGDTAGHRATKNICEKLDSICELEVINILNEDPASVHDAYHCLTNDRKSVLRWKISQKGLKA